MFNNVLSTWALHTSVRKVPLSWIVIYSKCLRWNNRMNREKPHLGQIPNILANWSKMPTIIYYQMCFFIPRCLWMLIDAIIGFDQHSHTHSLPLSVSLLPCSLSPLFLFCLKARSAIVWVSSEIHISPY